MPTFLRALRRPATLLFTGAALFLVARLWLVWLGALTGPFPRNGADALTYLWHGQYLMEGYSHDLPAVRDLIEQTKDAAQVVKAGGDWQYFANLRIMGSMAPVHDVIVVAALESGLPLHLAYAAVETIGVLVMTLAFTLLALRLAGPRGAGIGMGLLAMMELPRQGIATFIPSTLCLSLSVLMWALLLRRPKWPIIAILAALITLCHPVGQAHLVGAGLFYSLLQWFQPLPWKTRITRVATLGVIFLLAVSLPYINYAIWPQLRPTDHGIGLDFDLIDGVQKNFSYAVKMFWNALRWNPLFGILAVTSLFVTSRTQSRWRAATFAATTLLIVSLFHVLTGFPAETFSRVLVILAVIAAAAAGRFVVSGLRSSFWLGAAVFGAVATAVWFFVFYAFNDAHYNPILVNTERLGERLAAEKKEDSIVYLDASTAFQAALMAGAGSHHAIIVNNYKERARAIQRMPEGKPHLLLLPPPKALNSVSMIRPLSPDRKRMGFCMPFVEQVDVESRDDTPLRSVWIKVENNTSGFDMTVFWKNRQMRSTIAIVQIPGKHRGWMELKAPAEAGECTQLIIQTPRKRAWITGVSPSQGSDALNWPWGSSWIISYYPRFAPGPLAYRVRFDWTSLFAEHSMEEVLPLLDAGLQIESDDTGLLFLRGSRRSPSTGAE